MKTYSNEIIVESVINGQFKQAKEQLQHRIKTKPEAQAFKLAGVVEELQNLDHSEQATRFISMFRGD